MRHTPIEKGPQYWDTFCLICEKNQIAPSANIICNECTESDRAAEYIASLQAASHLLAESLDGHKRVSDAILDDKWSKNIGSLKAALSILEPQTKKALEMIKKILNLEDSHAVHNA